MTGALIQPIETYRLACLEVRGGNERVRYPAVMPGLDGWVSCRPLQPSARGGDLYYLTACSHGELARVTLADVAGHGEKVSAAATRLRNVLRQNVDRWEHSMLLRELNDSFQQEADNMEYATAFLISYKSQSGEMLFTNAGHPHPLWYRAGTGRWELMFDPSPASMELADLPLGMLPGTPYTERKVQLELGDVVVLYTDGISECRNEAGDFLGADRLLEIAGGLPLSSPVLAGEALLKAVEEFRGTAPPNDDETVLVLKRSAESGA